ncbi:MAG: HEAT repeat domain-containing protein [Anaerolineales bacterium]|nr:HEAT repeat domain-containing protein [Anaerolineales bacterium]
MAASPDFALVLEQLRDDTHTLPARALYQFSDLSKQDLVALEATWPHVSVERRRSVIHDLGEIAEANFEVRFDQVFRMALEDEDAEVRAAAIMNLWEEEAPDLIAPFLDLMQKDPGVKVRAAAASALGRFVYLGEIEEIPEKQLRRIEDALLATITGNDDLEVRRRALEALSFSSRPEVPALIEEAYHSPEQKLRVSAVFAMGRSADPRWGERVIAEMENDDAEIRFEAVRAAGELELREAVPALRRRLGDPDVQIHEAAIWSLGQVGGPDARAALLSLLDETEDEEEREYIEEALENLAFQDDTLDLPLLELDEDEWRELGDSDDDVPPPRKRLN